MAYATKHGRRPNEYASKAAHSQIINDPAVQAFLARCEHPAPPPEDVTTLCHGLKVNTSGSNSIRSVIAIDGSWDEVLVESSYPTAELAFLQLGALSFQLTDLNRMRGQPFIHRSDLARLKHIQRHKLVLPLRNIALRGSHSLSHTMRRAMYEFFMRSDGEETLMETLRWLIFQEYGPVQATWSLTSCPLCAARQIPIHKTMVEDTPTFPCPRCGGELYLTDILRLHERFDDEVGAMGVLSYVLTALEQLLLAHLIRQILARQPALLDEILFIKDGPLAFFGPTLSLQRAMMALVGHLFTHHNLYLVGPEKSGEFVDHANAIADQLEPGQAVLLNDAYIYHYILPGKADPTDPYGHSTYYSHKLIFKSGSGRVYVLTLPTPQVKQDPTAGDIPNLNAILTNIDALRCDLYDNALLPVALVNKLVSLSHHPSGRVLRRFARDRVLADMRP